MTRAIPRQRPTHIALALMLVVTAPAIAACSRSPTHPPSTAMPASSAPALVAERARCADLLGRYQLVDSERRRFRIPIDRALELVIDDPALLRPALLATSSSAPTSGPASPPTSQPGH